MKKTLIKVITVCMLIACLTCALVACGGNKDKTSDKPVNPPKEKLEPLPKEFMPLASEAEIEDFNKFFESFITIGKNTGKQFKDNDIISVHTNGDINWDVPEYKDKKETGKRITNTVTYDLKLNLDKTPANTENHDGKNEFLITITDSFDLDFYAYYKEGSFENTVFVSVKKPGVGLNFNGRFNFGELQKIINDKKADSSAYANSEAGTTVGFIDELLHGNNLKETLNYQLYPILVKMFTLSQKEIGNNQTQSEIKITSTNITNAIKDLMIKAKTINNLKAKDKDLFIKEYDTKKDLWKTDDLLTFINPGIIIAKGKLTPKIENGEIKDPKIISIIQNIDSSTLENMNFNKEIVLDAKFKSNNKGYNGLDLKFDIPEDTVFTLPMLDSDGLPANVSLSIPKIHIGFTNKFEISNNLVIEDQKDELNERFADSENKDGFIKPINAMNFKLNAKLNCVINEDTSKNYDLNIESDINPFAFLNKNLSIEEKATQLNKFVATLKEGEKEVLRIELNEDKSAFEIKMNNKIIHSIPTSATANAANKIDIKSIINIIKSKPIDYNKETYTLIIKYDSVKSLVDTIISTLEQKEDIAKDTKFIEFKNSYTQFTTLMTKLEFKTINITSPQDGFSSDISSFLK